MLPDRAVIIVGQYTLDALESPGFDEEGLTDIIRVHHKKDLEHKTVYIDPDFEVEIDTLYEPHYWFDLLEHVDSEAFNNELGRRVYDYHDEILTLVNLSEGSSSGLYPLLHRFLAKREKNVLGVSIVPSMSHSSDALFNAFASLGMVSIDGSTPLLLIDQARLEDYSGVHRMGEILKELDVVDYLVELLLDKRGFIRDLYKLSRNFDIGMFSALMATGCSLGIYESFRNILEVTLEQPLMEFDISTATMIYVLVRAPLYYRDEFTKGQIEYEVSQWLAESLGVDIPQICEPVFTDEFGDRVDVVILVGGFDTKKMFGEIYRRIERFSKMNLEQGLYDRELWEKIKEKLLGSQTYLPRL
ncbi:hypothetical protein E2P65_02945 [Candidatus Bathyarchaeota archaeon]|nr:hypothetical protein E2P65_02945 [Candidatus Bathyarchaeota archaeon]